MTAVSFPSLRHLHAHLAVIALAALCLLAAACGPSVSGDDDDDDTGIDARVDAVSPDGPGSDGDEGLPSRVYAHSGVMLYRIDTMTMAAIPVGAFTNLVDQKMLDIAVDRDERMVGVTRDKIFDIDETTAAATFLADFTTSGLTSLTFVPADISMPDGPEMLVAATDTGAIVRIDIVGQTATTAVIGDYGQHQGMNIVSSGDLVYVKDVGTIATVDVGPGGNDYVATVNPTNGWTATVVGTGTGFDKIFGVAFWGGTLYGFADTGPDTGAMLRLDRVTGTGTLIQPGAIPWFGAGVTTIAPIID